MPDTNQNITTADTPDAKQLRHEIDVLRTQLAGKDHELQIEAKLEKVRSRAMSMHTSDELREVVTVLFEQLKELEIPVTSACINIYIDGSKDMEVYACGQNKDGLVINYYRLPYFDHLISNDLQKAREGNVDFFSDHYSREEKNSFYTYVFAHSALKDLPHDVKKMILESDHYSISIAPVKNSMLTINDFEGNDISADQHNILQRFATVFEQAYIRFLDLQKAEAQAEEAKIEVALERVRSRSMGMQKSDELKEVIQIVYEQFVHLNINTEHAGFVMDYKLRDDRLIWVASKHGVPSQLTIPYFDSEYYNHFNEAKGKELDFFATNLNFDEKNRFYQQLFIYIPDLPEESKQFYFSCPGLAISTVLLENIALYIENFEGIPYSDADNVTLMRFGKVFQQTYTRFLDLQKAEAQARETKIELSLERVRAKAMSMQSSKDVNDAVKIVFEEMEKLDLGLLRCGIGILSKQHRTADVWTTSYAEGVQMQTSGDESIDIHPLLQGAHEAWLQQHDFNYTLEGDDLVRYYASVSKTNFRLREATAFIEAAKAKDAAHPLQQYYYVTPFESGNLFAFCETPFSAEAKNILQRFAAVFNLTYTRYLDLQKAEAQAQAAELERKRSESLLLNILPAEIAAELKQFGKSYARKHEQVTILFSDIKGFSTISETLSAEELVNQLDECFRAFDHIVEKHGLEKIKTIGDAYVCACGLPNPDPDNAIKTIRAALDMLAFTKGFNMSKKVQDLPAFDFRFGIHTGPVVTGVVGLKKFTYDIWGDAVNMAARMEQHGEAGRINISGATYALVKDKLSCTYRGKIEAKNKGLVDMYFVEA